ncbi:MAG: DUF5615 family PIN-like protein [Panacagrimonas sp.]
MLFLVDAQLPPALARWLASQGHQAIHVADIHLDRSPDTDIWAHAQEIEAVLITKDEDFSILRTRTSTGPQVVWIRRGNVSRKELLVWMEDLLPSLCETLSQGEPLIEIF